MNSTSNVTMTPIGTHVLVVDDDQFIRQMITDYLSKYDMRVTSLAGGQKIAETLKTETIDLIILDLKLPGEDGMQIAHRLRETSEIPIIMLTGLKDEADRVMGLELGADDYLTKPFSPRELLARIRALIRRSRSKATIPTETDGIRGYRFAGWEVNVSLRRAILPDGQKVNLTNHEFNLLAAFLTAPQRILTRDQLLSLSRLRSDEVYDRSIDVKIGRLRKKLALSGEGESAIIRTERGTGYMFTVPVDIVR